MGGSEVDREAKKRYEAKRKEAGYVRKAIWVPRDCETQWKAVLQILNILWGDKK